MYFHICICIINNICICIRFVLVLTSAFNSLSTAAHIVVARVSVMDLLSWWKTIVSIDWLSCFCYCIYSFCICIIVYCISIPYCICHMSAVNCLGDGKTVIHRLAELYYLYLYFLVFVFFFVLSYLIAYCICPVPVVDCLGDGKIDIHRLGKLWLY